MYIFGLLYLLVPFFAIWGIFYGLNAHRGIGAKITLGVYLILVGVILYHARNVGANAQKEATETKIEEAAWLEKERAKVDSLRTAHIETAHIAYGKATFGMSKAEYEKTGLERWNSIADESFLFYPSFTKEDKLYLLSIESLERNANLIDTELIGKVNKLRDVVSNKYGSPHAQVPYSFFDFKPGKTQWLYFWILGPKTIRIGLKENYEGATYSTVCHIFDQPTFKRVNEEYQEEKEKVKKESSNQF
ncbi:hypothetical protein BH24BAC1_BH24BAC1_25050 [soil metagenome]